MVANKKHKDERLAAAVDIKFRKQQLDIVIFCRHVEVFQRLLRLFHVQSPAEQ